MNYKKTIQVDIVTKKALDDFKTSKSESYDDVIVKLIRSIRIS